MDVFLIHFLLFRRSSGDVCMFLNPPCFIQETDVYLSLNPPCFIQDTVVCMFFSGNGYMYYNYVYMFLNSLWSFQ